MDILVPVRCDPVHFGHWLLVHDMLHQFHQVTVGIRDTTGDLFSTAERLEIAIAAFGKSSRLAVIVIADIDGCEAWKDQAAFDVVVTGNEQVKRAAEKYYTVMDMPRNGDYSATEIRRRLERGLCFEKMLVPGTGALIRRLWQRRTVQAPGLKAPQAVTMKENARSEANGKAKTNSSGTPPRPPYPGLPEPGGDRQDAGLLSTEQDGADSVS